MDASETFHNCLGLGVHCYSPRRFNGAAGSMISV